MTFRLQADAQGNFVDLYYSGSRESKVWKPTGIATRLQKIGGTTIAVLPVLTLRFEDGARDVLIYAAMSFMGLLSLDEDNPAAPGSDRIEVTPGPDGAWVINVTQTDENPLFPDLNHNGVDDDFEGAVEDESAPSTWQSLLADWQGSERLIPPMALRYDIPRVILEARQ
ncbi:MAG: hypothetical protein ACREIA_10285 [Opitutaceae bacterium]